MTDQQEAGFLFADRCWTEEHFFNSVKHFEIPRKSW